MATVKLVLRKEKGKKDGTYPIAIRIIKDRKPKYIHTGYALAEKDWNAGLSRVKKSYPNSARLNNLLLKKLAEATDIALITETETEQSSSKEIKKQIVKKHDTISFFQFGAERIRRKFESKVFSVAKSEISILHNVHEFLTHNTAQPKQKVIDGIKARRKERIGKARAGTYSYEEELNQFSKNNSLSFDDIDMGFVTRFKSFCASYLEQKTRTITNQLIFIRTLYNQAMKEGLVDGRNYPFGGDKERIRIGSGNKIGLTREEITRIEQLDLEAGTPMWHTRNVWLFSFYFAGIRISDVMEMRWSDFMDGRLYYQMNKNEKPISLKIPDQAHAILEAYQPDKTAHNDYVFPFLKKASSDEPGELFVKMRNATSFFNKYLKRIAEQCEITKPLSNHIARHSFGNIAGDKIHPLMLQKLYRHSDLKTTITYQANFIHKEADDALDSVLNG